jgi:hypothetical protein
VRSALASDCCRVICCESAESDRCGAAAGARLPNEPKPPGDPAPDAGADADDDDGADVYDDGGAGLRDEKPFENDFDAPDDERGDDACDEDENEDEDEGRATASWTGCAISVSTQATRNSIVRVFDMATWFPKKLE